MSSSILPLTSACTQTPSPTSTNITFLNSSTFISNSKPFSQQSSKNNHKNHHVNNFKLSCNITPPNNDTNNNQKPLIIPEPQTLILPNLDRRNLLIGAGLYTTVNFTNSIPSALAEPITSPNISSSCKTAAMGIGNMKDAVRTRACCPPGKDKPIKTFVFPKEKTVKMRWPAHRGTPENIEKYKKAIQAMRDLPDDHPHSFIQQAKIHCAYCNGGYTQVENGFPDIDIQIHNSWLFFPFHRWYLYFYERILGKLINDPTFALPYWNWDNPTGMTIPSIFEEGGKGTKDNPNSLFDAYRDGNHLPPTIVDLNFSGESDASCLEQIGINLSTMYRQMVSSATSDTLFFGGKYVAGDPPVANGAKSIGSIEAGCHTAVHRWVGDSRMPNNEDMGNFYSAGYDPLFYVHHTNVDRMWKIWKDLGIPGHSEPTSSDWLNASYVFYDENEELVRVYNKDSVKIEDLKYGYERSEIPWLKGRPVPRSKNSKIALKSIGKVKKVQDVKFPVKLDKVVEVLVKRPAVNRSSGDKEKATEVLLINGILFDGEAFVKFDVFVNDKEDGRPSLPSDSEFAGSFSQVPHSDMNKMLMSSAAKFGISELLEDTEAEGDEFVLVKLVPRAGCDDLSISEIKIELVPIV
ncbi:hypothetical protein L6452_00513 [Arctium lappa]|uniref:Uncharacterized protein n=1 Tax=Arctium lappa TaxID=4217 RepID=A0ACB9FEX4_ARCLA|nr:hypothetical protein L6452_00513 [Arctium lappa]